MGHMENTVEMLLSMGPVSPAISNPPPSSSSSSSHPISNNDQGRSSNKAKANDDLDYNVHGAHGAYGGHGSNDHSSASAPPLGSLSLGSESKEVHM